MTRVVADAAPKRIARIAAVLFLFTMVLGIVAQVFIADRLVVWGDAAKTAANFTRHRGLHHWGFTIYMIEMAGQVAMTVYLYVLMKPVNPSVALAALSLGLAGAVIKTFGRLFFLAPTLLLGDRPYLGVFTPEQLQALALFLLRLDDHAAAMALGFFGLHGVLKGWLIFRSTFLPRWLGVMTIVSGIGLLSFLSPTLGYRLFPIVALLTLVGAIATIVWLLVFGVDEKRWKEVAIGRGAAS